MLPRSAARARCCLAESYDNYIFWVDSFSTEQPYSANGVLVMMKCDVDGCSRAVAGGLQLYMDVTDHDGQDELLEPFKHGWCKQHERVVLQRYRGRARLLTLRECFQ
jgi:hypothetical protein